MYRTCDHAQTEQSTYLELGSRKECATFLDRVPYELRILLCSPTLLLSCRTTAQESIGRENNNSKQDSEQASNSPFISSRLNEIFFSLLCCSPVYYSNCLLLRWSKREKFRPNGGSGWLANYFAPRNGNSLKFRIFKESNWLTFGFPLLRRFLFKSPLSSVTSGSSFSLPFPLINWTFSLIIAQIKSENFFTKPSFLTQMGKRNEAQILRGVFRWQLDNCHQGAWAYAFVSSIFRKGYNWRRATLNLIFF